MGEDRSSGSGLKRRRLLFGLLALLLAVAGWWGPALREAAALSAIRGAIAGHDWPKAEALLRAGLPEAAEPTLPRARAAAAEPASGTQAKAGKLQVSGNLALATCDRDR